MKTSITREEIGSYGIPAELFLGKFGETMDTLTLVKEYSKISSCDINNVKVICGDFNIPNKIVEIGTNEFWETVNPKINAFTICSRGEIKAYSQPHGHYSDFTSEGTSNNFHSKHWFHLSIHKPIDVDVFDKDVVYTKDTTYRWDTSNYLYIRPNQPRVKFDLENIDWDLVPEWATQILCVSCEKDEVQFWDKNGFIRGDGVIWYRRYNEVNHHKCHNMHDPYGYFDYHYEILNHPKKATIYERPQ